MSKKKINMETHGKTVAKPGQSVYEILGYSERKTFTGMSYEQYKDFLEQSNILDIRRECLKVGLIPNQDRRVMVSRLMDQYGKYAAKEKSKTLQAAQPKKLSKEARDVLDRAAQ